MSNVKKQLQDLYINVIEEKIGAVAKVDEYDNVEFKIIKYGVFDIFIYEDDPEYFRIRAGLDLSGNTILSECDFVTIANDINNRRKAVKVALEEYSDNKKKYFKVTIEAFLAGSNQLPEKTLLEAIIERSVSALQSTLDTISKRIDRKMEELAEQKGQKAIAPPA